MTGPKKAGTPKRSAQRRARIMAAQEARERDPYLMAVYELFLGDQHRLKSHQDKIASHP